MPQDNPATPQTAATATGTMKPDDASAEMDMPMVEYRSCVAICTLTSEALREKLSEEPALSGVLVGALNTENLGIEHLISYTVGNTNIRYIVVCGEDGRQAIGHLPGQSFLSLARNGLDEQGNIIGAKGKRPVIQNISRRSVEHFRRYVEVIDMIGCEDIPAILDKVRECVENNPGLAETFVEDDDGPSAEVVQGYRHDRMVMDPCGYFVIYVERTRGVLMMEHYDNKGALDLLIEGKSGPELYFPAIDRGLISRLDHAAYLGRELDRAELALKTGLEYVQDTRI